MAGIKTKAPRMVLAGDIGGTKTRLTVFCFEHQQCRLTVEKTFYSKGYPSLEMILGEFLRGEEKIASVLTGQ